jgi:uncharacterized protein YoxC
MLQGFGLVFFGRFIMSKLQSIIEASEFFHQMMPADNCMVVTNAEGIIEKFHSAKTFNLPFTVGNKIPEQGAAYECFTKKIPIIKIVPKEIVGATIRSFSYPIFDAKGTMLGLYTLALSVEKQFMLHNAAENIAATSEQVTATVEELATTASTLAFGLDVLKEAGQKVINNLKNTDEILQFVSQVSTSSNLLGLNAAIEAARAGEQGRGFAVVADEIRKMADNCAMAVKDIRKIISAIREDTAGIISKVNETAIIGERQAAATQQISAAMIQLSSAVADVETASAIV